MKTRYKISLKLIIALALVAAFFKGQSRTTSDYLPILVQLYPDHQLVRQADNLFDLYLKEGERELPAGWLCTGSHSGYGGKLVVAAAVDTSGKVINVKLVDHKESTIFFKLANPDLLFKSYKGKTWLQAVNRKADHDGRTGATKSVNAIVSGTRKAVAQIASEKLNQAVPARSAQIKIGVLEVTLLLLFIAGLVYSRNTPSTKRKRIRLACQVLALIVIGFWKNAPLHTANISSFLMGYFPPFVENMALYLIAGGFVLSILISGKNIHCLFVCPFGTAQRLIGMAGVRKKRLPAKAAFWIKQGRKVWVFTIVVLALYFARPGYVAYEPFGTLFKLQGTMVQWILLVIAVVASLFLRNPWCNFLCPAQVFSRIINGVRTNCRKVLP